MLLEDRTEATRPQWRIPCQKGVEGYVVPPDLGMGGEDESADVAGRWVKVWRGGKVKVDCGGRPFDEKGAPLC